MILPAGCTVVFWEDGSHGQIDVDPLILWLENDYGSFSSGAVPRSGRRWRRFLVKRCPVGSWIL